jgi:hypothetical protein
VSKVRITHWPGLALPVPPLALVSSAELRDEDWLVIRTASRGTEVAAPDDFFLREALEVDPRDRSAVLEFVRNWGMPQGPHQTYDDCLADSLLDTHYLASLRRHDRHRESVRRVSERSDTAVLHVRELGPCFDTLQALAAHWVDYCIGGSRQLRSAWLNRPGVSPPRDRNEAWEYFETALNAALRPFQIRVGISNRDPSIPMEVGAAGFVGVASLQLANIIADDLPVRLCANETCDRPFTVQRGRAQRARYQRSDAMYCSAACARAQAQRRYRSRKTAS